MSLGYADRLSDREDLGGRLGAPEIFDKAADVVAKAHQLADMITEAGTMMAFTGAGISTSCGIPDFRGPRGVWTLQRAGKPAPALETTFVAARPTLTHAALLGLMGAGRLVYICSQNVDSLHLRSGVPRDQLAELHGNCFAERCSRCKAEYVREFEMDTVGFKPTGRSCSRRGCGAALCDHILDWEDPLPPAELKASEQHATAVGLSLCLGTSLQIVPAANLPLRTLRSGGRLAIVNLQATPKDKRATLVLHAKVDTVMALVMHRLGVPLPTYTRKDHVLLSFTINTSTPNTSTDQGTLVPPATAADQPAAGAAPEIVNGSGPAAADATAAAPSAEPNTAGKGRPRRARAASQQQQGPGAVDPPGAPCPATSITCPVCGCSVQVVATSSGSSSWGDGQGSNDKQQQQQPKDCSTANGSSLVDLPGPAAANSSRPNGCWSFELVVGSPAGSPWPLPLVHQVRVSFPGSCPQLSPGLVTGPAPFRLQRMVHASNVEQRASGSAPAAAAAAASDPPVQQQQPSTEPVLHTAVAGEPPGTAAAPPPSPAAPGGVQGGQPAPAGVGGGAGPCCVVMQLELELVAAAADPQRRYVQVPYLVVRDWHQGVTTPNPAGATHTALPGHLVPFTSQVVDYTHQQQQLVAEALATAEAADPTPTAAAASGASKGGQQQKPQQGRAPAAPPPPGRPGGTAAPPIEQGLSEAESEGLSSESSEGGSSSDPEVQLPAVGATRRGRTVKPPAKYARRH